MLPGNTSEPDAIELAGRLRAARPNQSGTLGRRVGLDALLATVIGAEPAEHMIGRYRIETKVGEGGMGMVYRARDTALDRTVALKVLKGSLSGDMREQLRQEGVALARLSHPGVVGIYDIGVHEGEPYIAMEYVDGASLRAWLLEHPEAEWRAITRLFVQAAHGLAAAHRAGIVHGDFKPDNVLVDREGRVRVADFGLARVDGADAQEAHIVRCGTPEYMSPEQYASASADARSDQYSFCLSLLRTLEASRNAGARSDLPPVLRVILTRGLHRDPTRRHDSMESVAAALETLLRTRPVDRARGLLLDRVERFWSTGVLDASLGGLEPLDLPLRDACDRVDSPLGIPLRENRDTALTTRDLPDLLDLASGSLLVLGAPGAGKTTTLLLLVRDLVRAARTDPDQPIPVMLSLTSLGDFEGDLEAWIADEIVTKYSMARKRCRDWLQNNELVLIFDGLDELASANRRPCVEAINRFRREHPVPMIIACREDAHDGIGMLLQFGGAVRVEPLDETVIDAFLARLGADGEPIRTALVRDPRLRDHLRSPLMLAFIAIAGPRVLARGADVRLATLEGYVEHMFARRPADDPREKTRTLRRLRWVAKTMRRLGQSELWLERIQAEWLEHRWQRVLGVLAGVLGVIFVAWMVNVLTTFAASFFAPPYVHTLALTAGALAWVFPYVHTLRVRPIEKLTWSRGRGFKRMVIGTLFTVPVAMLTMSASWIPVLLAGTMGAAVGLIYGFEPSDSPTRVEPNQGVRQSLRNAVLVGSVSSIATFSLMGLLIMPAFERAVGIDAVIAAGANPGYAAAIEAVGCVAASLGMIFGGYAVTLHAGLRVVLAATSPIPLLWLPFLDRAVDLGILRRVGGGYIFVHRTMLEYFAETSR